MITIIAVCKMKAMNKNKLIKMVNKIIKQMSKMSLYNNKIMNMTKKQMTKQIMKNKKKV